MLVDMNAVVRKMLLLGVPLFSPGCDSSCGDGPRPLIERQLTIQNPNLAAADGGMPSAMLVEAYRKCVEEGLCLDLCRKEDPRVQSCRLVPDDAGAASRSQIVLSASLPAPLCEGRRPDCDRHGPPPVPPRAPSPVGAWLARSAYLERRSVPAFERLANELSAHGAPDALVSSARRAAKEEIRHESAMTSLARRWGARPARSPGAPPGHVRALEELAMENAAEGCVRETLGALVACWQAQWAQDCRIRSAMKVIARDEARHAELAWQVHAWAKSRLGAKARRRLASTVQAEACRLRGEVADAGEPHPSLVEAAGLPSSASGIRIAAGAEVLIWSQATAAA